MTRYTELRHAGYYQHDLTDAERTKIADQVDNAPERTITPRGSTTSHDVTSQPKRSKKR